jgi:predicted house-cleaning NTP pyrophosphatase (Maf/HAM1 superfamily)
MKNIYDVMRQKELEIERLKKEIEALRVVAPMLEDREPAPIAASTAAAKPYSSTQQNNEPVIAADTGKAARVWP